MAHRDDRSKEMWHNGDVDSFERTQTWPKDEVSEEWIELGGQARKTLGENYLSSPARFDALQAPARTSKHASLSLDASNTKSNNEHVVCLWVRVQV